MLVFLQCVGQAVAAKGMRGLLGLAPFGEQLYDISSDAIKRYRDLKREKELRGDLEQAVQAELEQVRAEAARIVREVAGDREFLRRALVQPFDEIGR